MAPTEVPVEIWQLVFERMDPMLVRLFAEAIGTDLRYRRLFHYMRNDLPIRIDTALIPEHSTQLLFNEAAKLVQYFHNTTLVPVFTIHPETLRTIFCQVFSPVLAGSTAIEWPEYGPLLQEFPEVTRRIFSLTLVANVPEGPQFQLPRVQRLRVQQILKLMLLDMFTLLRYLQFYRVKGTADKPVEVKIPTMVSTIEISWAEHLLVTQVGPMLQTIKVSLAKNVKWNQPTQGLENPLLDRVEWTDVTGPNDDDELRECLRWGRPRYVVTNATALDPESLELVVDLRMLCLLSEPLHDIWNLPQLQVLEVGFFCDYGAPITLSGTHKLRVKISGALPLALATSVFVADEVAVVDCNLPEVPSHIYSTRVDLLYNPGLAMFDRLPPPLTYLKLSACQIADIAVVLGPDFDWFCGTLETLLLDYNHLTSIPPLANYSALFNLDLSSNKIGPDLDLDAPLLIRIDLANNKLENVSVQAQTQFVNLENNPVNPELAPYLGGVVQLTEALPRDPVGRVFISENSTDGTLPFGTQHDFDQGQLRELTITGPVHCPIDLTAVMLPVLLQRLELVCKDRVNVKRSPLKYTPNMFERLPVLDQLLIVGCALDLLEATPLLLPPLLSYLRMERNEVAEIWLANAFHLETLQLAWNVLDGEPSAFTWSTLFGSDFSKVQLLFLAASKRPDDGDWGSFNEKLSEVGKQLFATCPPSVQAIEWSGRRFTWYRPPDTNSYSIRCP